MKYEPLPLKLIPATEHHGPYIEDQNGETVCDLYCMVCSQRDMPGKPHTFPNAEFWGPFLAASPLMFEALKRVHGGFTGEGGITLAGADLDMIEAALKAAEGEVV